jgi:VCBS repeat-containing protein
LALACACTAGADAAPSVSGSHTSRITDIETTNAFDQVEISGASTVSVSVVFTGAQGWLTPLTPFFTSNSGTYTLAATNTTGAEVFIRSVVFHPAKDRKPVGDTETTTFTLVAEDTSGARDTNTDFRVISTSVNDVPVLAGAGSTNIFDNQTVRPFAGLTLRDPDPDALLDVTVTLLTTNDAPTTHDDEVATDEKTPLLIPFSLLVANDPDVDTDDNATTQTSLQVVAVPANSLLGAAVSLTSTGVLYNTTVSTNLRALARKEPVLDAFSYRASDGFGGASEARVEVTVLGVNDSPVAVPDFATILEDQVLTVPAPGVMANDIEYDINGVPRDDALQVLPMLNRPTTLGGRVTVRADGSYFYDPTGSPVLARLGPGDTNVDTFTYTVIDSSLTIANDDAFAVKGDTLDNDLPVLENDTTLAGTGGSVRLYAVGAPDRGGVVTMNAAGNALIYTPQASFAGVETFTYRIVDGQGGSDWAVVRVTVAVTRLSGNLTANADRFTVAQGTSATLDVLLNDRIFPDSTLGLSVARVDAPDQGGVATLNPAGDRVIYTPAAAFVGVERFSYELSGGGTARATGVVEVAVVDRSNQLNVNEDVFTVPQDSGANPLPVLANDLGRTKAERVTVHVVQRGSDRSTATVSITVIGENDPPVITGAHGGQTVYQKLTLQPFCGVTITEIDHQSLQPLIVTVTVSPASQGYLATLGPFVDLGGGVYRLGSGLGVTAAEATAALRNLTFVPTTGNRVTPGAPETTGFTISVDDHFAPPVVDTNTTVTAYHAEVTQVQTTTVPDNDNYGQPVAAARDIVVVGAPFDKNAGGQSVGAAYVFVWRSGTFNTWDLARKVMAPDGASSDQFGYSVALDGDILAVGAPQRIENSRAVGVVYLFARHQDGSNAWGFVKKILAADGAAGDTFGNAVAVSGNTLAVGA